MTDADVDGLHIRTLLLTFFFRYMPQVIEKGYLYIAQTPLYKIVKKGKGEYLQDEQALKDYLIENATKGNQLIGSNGKNYVGKSLKELIKTCTDINSITSKYQKIPIGVLETILLCNDAQKIEKRLVEIDPLSNWSIESDDNKIIIHKTFQGIRNHFQYNESIFGNNDLIKLKELFSQVSEIFYPNHAEFAKEKIYYPSGLFNTIESKTRSEVSLQRFKGLGEMNPEQLWETTLNPNTRALLQVKIDEVEAADQMFSILMGDTVAPRRDFIIDNALNAENIDI
jgi:DNA gyrase subunit B